MKTGKILYSFYILFLFLITIFIGVKPYYNMDMLPYMAIILKMDGERSISKIHSTTYNVVKETVSSNDYAELVAGTSYRESLYRDEASFNEQLSFYVIKPLYLIFSFLFYKAGVDLPFSTVLPSLISYFFIGLLILYWIAKILPFPWLAVWSCLFIITSGPFISLGKSSAPDGISTLFLLAGCYLFLEKKSLWKITLFFVLSILTRPDSIILVSFIFLIIVLGKWYRKVPALQLLGCFFLFFISYYIPKLFVEEVAWSTLFYHAFVERVLYPVTDPHPLSVSDYLAVIAHNIVHRTYFAITYLLVILLFAGVVFWDRFKQLNFNLKEWTLNQAFMLALVAAIVVRFFLFPAFLDRFMAVFLFLSAIIFIKEAYPRIFYNFKGLKAGVAMERN